MYPRLEININKLKTNLQVISNLLKKNNLSLAMVTKAYCANINIVTELVKDNNLVDYLADSRIENLKKMKDINIPKILLRIPMKSEVEEVVKYSDISFNSEYETLEKLNEVAKKNNKNVSIHLIGQEVNPETYAISKADLLIRGGDTVSNNVFYGSTLSDDKTSGEHFDFMLSNPPYGKTWKTDLSILGIGSDKDLKKNIIDKRFVTSYKEQEDFRMIPDVSDGQLLFLLNNISKMKDTELGSRIIEVHNGSALFTGDAGNGASNARRYMIEEDLISKDSRVVLVNDGSKDKTWKMIEELHKKNPLFSGINLSRNRGHQNALLAGLMTVKDHCDVSISMDADLQDDINAMDEMMKKYLEGADVVYGVRSARTTDTFFKRFTAEAFYKVMEKLGANTVFNHADYRLMSKRALEGLAQFKEVNLFLRGIVPMIGYPSDIVTYERAERFAGESKYPLSKMLAFAFEGITSLSVKLIRFITIGGALMIFIAAIVFFYTLYSYFAGFARPGWSSLMISMWFIGGMIMISLGIVGEYVGKIYLETKGRPRFIVEQFLNEEKNEEE